MPASEKFPMSAESRSARKNVDESLVLRTYRDLKEIARLFLARERIGHTLQPTDLVHEAWLRMADDAGPDGRTRADFGVLVGQTMRRILVDHARKRAAVKRGGGARRLTLHGGMFTNSDKDFIDLIELDDALNRLAEMNPRHAKVVELRYFAGMTVDETAAALNVSDWTVKGDWRVARAWLMTQFEN